MIFRRKLRTPHLYGTQQQRTAQSRCRLSDIGSHDRLAWLRVRQTVNQIACHYRDVFEPTSTCSRPAPFSAAAAAAAAAAAVAALYKQELNVVQMRPAQQRTPPDQRG